MKSKNEKVLYGIIILLATIAIWFPILSISRAQAIPARPQLGNFDAEINANANVMLEKGRQIFRFDTFGDEAFWGGTLQLHNAIKGAALGGVGPGVSAAAALDPLGLKVDVDALPQPLIQNLRK